MSPYFFPLPSSFTPILYFASIKVFSTFMTTKTPEECRVTDV